VLLSDRYDIPSNICFLGAQGYTVFSKDESSVTISELLNQGNIVQLKTVKNETTSIPIPTMKSKASEEKTDLNYAQTLSQSTKTSSPEPQLPGLTATVSQHEIIIATDLNLVISGKNIS